MFVKRNMDLTAERLLQIMSKEKKMKRNKMGNLLSIAGDDAEDIKKFIDFFYRKIRKAMIRKRNA